MCECEGVQRVEKYFRFSDDAFAFVFVSKRLYANGKPDADYYIAPAHVLYR